MNDCQEFALAGTINVGPKIKPMSLEGRTDMYVTGQDHTNCDPKPPTVIKEDTTRQDKCLGSLRVSEVSVSLEKTEAMDVDLDLNLKQSTPAEAEAEAETETEKGSASCVSVSLDIADLDARGEVGRCAKDSVSRDRAWQSKTLEQCRWLISSEACTVYSEAIRL